MRRHRVGLAVAAAAFAALGTHAVVTRVSDTRPASGCHAPSTSGDEPAACRYIYRGHPISFAEGEARHAAGSRWAAVTPEGIFLFDTVAELDRFDRQRLILERRLTSAGHRRADPSPG